MKPTHCVSNSLVAVYYLPKISELFELCKQSIRTLFLSKISSDDTHENAEQIGDAPTFVLAL